MSYTFRSAASINEATPLLVGVASGTGGGKTFSLLRMARGVVGPTGRIVVGDTEKRRSLHYRKDFDFDFAEINPPFTPEAYLDFLEAAEKAKYDAILFDSASHIWAGDGGLHDMHLAEVERLSGGDARKAERVNVLAWSKPKQRYKKFITRLLQSRAHLFFGLRAEQKTKPVEVEENGRKFTKYLDAGWLPICEKHFMYEMTCSFTMVSDAPGVPQPIKLPKSMQGFFPLDQQVGERAGELLAQWSLDPHYGLNKSIEGKRGKEAAPATGVKLMLFAPDGAQAGEYATGGTWLTGFEKALNAADPENAGKLWDVNQELFYKIQAGATERKDSKAIERCAEVGRLAIARSTAGGQQGDLLGAKA